MNARFDSRPAQAAPAPSEPNTGYVAPGFDAALRGQTLIAAWARPVQMADLNDIADIAQGELGGAPFSILAIIQPGVRLDMTVTQRQRFAGFVQRLAPRVPTTAIVILGDAVRASIARSNLMSIAETAGRLDAAQIFADVPDAANWIGERTPTPVDANALVDTAHQAMVRSLMALD